MNRPGARIALASMVLAALAVAAPAAAHGLSARLLDVRAHEMAHAAGRARSADGDGAVVASLVLGLAVLALARGGRRLGPQRRRRVLSLALCLVLAVLAVETGVHSVHHLTDPRAASECAVLAGTQNLTGDAPHPVVIAGPPLVVVADAPARSGESPRWLLDRPR
ncbi:MAG TPA: hypothetical protein VF197_16080, partial [Methylomirabilota bacterium]